MSSNLGLEIIHGDFEKGSIFFSAAPEGGQSYNIRNLILKKYYVF